MSYPKDLVSVIIPVFNAEKYIGETIESVINQTYKNWELILINDGSSDKSEKIINAFGNSEKIKVLHHPGRINLGVSRSRELGVQESKGDFIAFLDADDLFKATKLEKQILLFNKIEDIILVHSSVELINNTNLSFDNEFILEDSDNIYNLHNRQSWLRNNEICNSTVIVKSKILKEIQFGLPQLFQYEDWLLWSLIAEKGKFYYLNKPLTKYRVHAESATAGILKNSLISPYSKIEYLLSLYSFTETDEGKDKTINELKFEIVRLFEIYSKNNTEKIEDFRLKFFSLQNSYNLYSKELLQISKENLKLKKKVSELNKIKNSKTFILLGKIRKFINMLKLN